MFENKNILITGGSGTFGKAFTKFIFENYNPQKVIIYSRDEFKQDEMRKAYKSFDSNMRYFIGDVRDRDRLYTAMAKADFVVHAAALKQVPSCEYNPFEAIKTNVMGAVNVIDAAISRGVEKVVALSTDKAVNPVNLYGATKLCSDKLFISGNSYSGHTTAISLVRYGNVAGSRGSVIPFFRKIVDSGKRVLPITDIRMTRFWIDIQDAIRLVLIAFMTSRGGETYISKIPSFKITDLVKAFDCEYEVTGIRPGEKLHEMMISQYDAPTTYEMDTYYTIYPQGAEWFCDEPVGKKVDDEFEFVSNRNRMYSVDELKGLLCAF